ncbi:hypothetical protein ACQPZX_16270 [Actinoplanes sp. CA-142083]|uniref:hypothetical protein n=1 Tax=Actinoplanes sp. CA-142083 TaxID=3239903 RepID=UPI003D943E51
MVDASHGQGIQAGDNNHQTNVFMQQAPIDLAALSSHGAADKVKGLSRDDAVVALARLPVDEALKILEVVLADDEGLAVSLLAHMNHRRAQELVAELKAVKPWLENLPAASAAIAACEQAARVELGERVGQIEHAGPSGLGTEGYRQRHRNGAILWSARGGATVVPPPAADVQGVLGFPLGVARRAQRSPSGTDGTFQRFEGPSGEGATLYCSERHGFAAIQKPFLTYHDRMGGTGGQLGFPTRPADSVSHTLTTVLHQPFEGGMVYAASLRSPGRLVAVGVFAEMLEYHEAHNRIMGPLGFPLDDAVDVVSPHGTSGRRQDFTGSGGEDSGPATIYTSTHGTFAVRSSIRARYEQLAGAVGSMGLPIAEEVDSRIYALGLRRGYQAFEGGAIYTTSGRRASFLAAAWQKRERTIEVRKAVIEMFASSPGLERTLGFPREVEKRLAESDDDAVQFFENGVVTIRGGRAQAWVRPGAGG